jgi:hypothetical protein
MNSKQQPQSNTWWKCGFVWLVIAGPAIVAVAALLTAWVAVSQDDPLVVEDYYRRGIEINKIPAADKALLPALQGRNHTATPTIN